MTRRSAFYGYFSRIKHLHYRSAHSNVAGAARYIVRWHTGRSKLSFHERLAERQGKPEATPVGLALHKDACFDAAPLCNWSSRKAASVFLSSLGTSSSNLPHGPTANGCYHHHFVTYNWQWVRCPPRTAIISLYVCVYLAAFVKCRESFILFTL